MIPFIASKSSLEDLSKLEKQADGLFCFKVYFPKQKNTKSECTIFFRTKKYNAPWKWLKMTMEVPV